MRRFSIALRAITLASFCALPALALGCATAPEPRDAEPHELRSVTEGRATQIAQEVFRENGVRVENDWAVQIAPEQSLDVDHHFVGTTYGLEWLSPQDRATLGDAVPTALPDGQLQIVPGFGDDHAMSVLILDHETYKYDPDRDRVQRGATGVREAESRLRRDVEDYVQHVRSVGGLDGA